MRALNTYSKNGKCQLWNWADDSRVLRPDYGEVSAGLFDATAAIFWHAGACGDGKRICAGLAAGGEQDFLPPEHHDGARAAAAAFHRAVCQRNSVYLHGTAGRDQLAHLLRIAEQGDLRPARSEEPSEGIGRFRGACSAKRKFGEIRAEVGVHRLRSAGKEKKLKRNPQQVRQQAHELLDMLPDEKLNAVHTLLEVMVEPLSRSLALAAVEEDELTPETAAALERSRASLASA